MVKIYTPPDMNFDRSVPKVLIRNCDWSHDKIVQVLEALSDKEYDIYLYHDNMNDIQWAEGIRAQAVKQLDCNHHKEEDPVVWVKKFDDEFNVQ